MLKRAAIALALVTTSAFAQESALDSARAAVRANGNDPNASLALGRALLRAGHYAEAATELRRGAATMAGHQPDAAIKLHWELARTFIAQRDFLKRCSRVAWSARRRVEPRRVTRALRKRTFCGVARPTP